MKIIMTNDNDSIGELKLISFIESTISSGWIDSIDLLSQIIKDYLKSKDDHFVHGHRSSEYFEIDFVWNVLFVHHLNSKAERDRVIVKIEL